MKKKLKNEKIGLITSDLQEVSGQALATMTVRGQHLLQANKPTSDDDDESDGDDTVVAGETWCSESEGMLSESDSLNDVTVNLHHHWQRKGVALEEDRVPQVLRSINRRITSLYSCRHPRLASSPLLYRGTRNFKKAVMRD